MRVHNLTSCLFSSAVISSREIRKRRGLNLCHRSYRYRLFLLFSVDFSSHTDGRLAFGSSSSHDSLLVLKLRSPNAYCGPLQVSEILFTLHEVCNFRAGNDEYKGFNLLRLRRFILFKKGRKKSFTANVYQHIISFDTVRFDTVLFWFRPPRKIK